MYTFLTNDSFRHRLLQNVRDPSVRQFWQMQYDDLSPSQRYQRVEPLVGRLESLVMGRSLVRNIVGQRETTINFRQAIFNHEALFFSLPLKTLSHDARLVGTMLTSLIHGTIFSFGDIPEHQHPGVSLYVDEFQEFATSDFDEMFTQGRKFGLRMTVAHQYRKQLSRELQSSTLFAKHTLELNDIIISAALLKHSHKNIWLESFRHERDLKRTPYKAKWQGGRFNLIPDSLLLFRVTVADGRQGRLPIVVEHDRGSEEQKYFRRRIRAYLHMLRNEGYKQLFGVNGITVARKHKNRDALRYC